MSDLKQYDYIITGGGCAGLSLLYRLLHSSLRNHRILLIDKEEKVENDRTWCFWEQGEGSFEHLVFCRWQHMYFYSDTYSERLDLAPYHYKMIRGIDFYQHIHELIAASPNVERIQDTVNSVAEQQDIVRVKTDSQEYEGRWVFNSIRQKEEKAQAIRHHYLLQHFKGWVIRTKKPRFNPEEAVLMDFRIPQENDCRFIYVLPTDAHTALVEYTLFSADLLPQEAYSEAIRQYLQKYLQMEEDDYQIEHEEFGVIPMTDMPFPTSQGKRIINIGTAGGITKPSTGYTFKRIQEDTLQIVCSLEATGTPCRVSSRWHQRFDIYDGALLHVLAQKLRPADQVFTALFKNNTTERVFRFLDEKTNFWEEIQVANSVQRLAFIKGVIYALSR